MAELAKFSFRLAKVSLIFSVARDFSVKRESGPMKESPFENFFLHHSFAFIFYNPKKFTYSPEMGRIWAKHCQETLSSSTSSHRIVNITIILYSPQSSPFITKIILINPTIRETKVCLKHKENDRVNAKLMIASSINR
jgi:hypothetical protein